MYRALFAILVTAVLGSVVVSTGSGAQNATRQRIAIEQRFDMLESTGTWQVYPLTPGPVTRDSGTFTYSGGPNGNAVRNGATVTLIVGRHTLAGKKGMITLSHRVESMDVRVGSGYSADVGTWKLAAVTGSYAGFKGGGRLAAVGLPSGVVIVRQEGWVAR
jgi:hypothetical protein